MFRADRTLLFVHRTDRAWKIAINFRAREIQEGKTELPAGEGGKKKDGGRSATASEGGDAVVNKGGRRCASRGFNPRVGAYFTVCGPISRRQSEPARDTSSRDAT